MRNALTPICLGFLLASPALSEAPAVQLRYQPTPGVELFYQAKLSALIDFALGHGAHVTGDMRFCLTPGVDPDDEGDRRVAAVVREGSYQVQGQGWDFTEQALSWEWVFSPLRRVRRAEGTSPQGLAAILELGMGVVFSTDFPASAIHVGDTWETSRATASPDGGAVFRSCTHTLVGIEDTPEYGTVADVESRLDLPVDANFIGALWAGVFTGTETTRFRVADGEVVSARIAGRAELVGGGAKVVLRDLTLTLERAADTPTSTGRRWTSVAERNPGLSGSYVTDAVLSANLVKYLRDDWILYSPRARFAVSDGFLLGAGIVARRSRQYLVEADAYLGTSSMRGAYSLSLTRGYPVRPTDQQYLNLVSNSASREARLGVTHFSGRRLGAAGIPRMRYSASLALSRLLPHTEYFRTAGTANYVTLEATRFRSGASLVPRRKLDWEAAASLTIGSSALGSHYSFTLADVSLIGTMRLSDRSMLAARGRLATGSGDVPDQFRTALVDRTALRGYDLTTAPLAKHAATASLEYRTHLGKADLFDPIGETDWWGAVFVDSGIGGSSLAQLRRSRVYADVGLTLRVGAEYRSVPVYGYMSLAWPLVEGRSDPRLTFGVDWAF